MTDGIAKYILEKKAINITCQRICKFKTNKQSTEQTNKQHNLVTKLIKKKYKEVTFVWQFSCHKYSLKTGQWSG